MKRLTIRHSDGRVSQPSTTGLEILLYRLAEYEDTGLEPEEIKAMIAASMRKAIAELKEFEGVPIDRLRELAEADKEGRCVVPPCKVGDTVFIHDIIEYEIDEAGNNQYLIVPCTVVEIILHKNKIQVKCKESRDCIWTIKENAFITKEAAEAALKEREQNE